MPMSDVKDGDFIVEQTQFGVECRKVVKVTAKLIFCDRAPYIGQRRIRTDEIVFAGVESDARRVAAQLVSSRARYNEECQNAQARRIERDRKIVKQAELSKGD